MHHDGPQQQSNTTEGYNDTQTFMQGYVCELTIINVFQGNPRYMKCSMMHCGKVVSINVWMGREDGMALGGKKTFWGKFTGEIVGGSFHVEHISCTHFKAIEGYT